MRRALTALALLTALLVGACSSGSTEVQGLSGGGTGATAETGPTGATTTGPTGATSTTGVGGEFDGPVSLDLGPLEIPGFPVERAFFSCDGALGTWRYIFQGDFGAGVSFDIDATVDLSSGSGTLVFGGSFEVAQAGSVTWEDTIDLEIRGTAEAPMMLATKSSVEVSGSIPIPVEVFESFPENQEFPILPGSDGC